MYSRDRIRQVVFKALDDANRQLPRDQRLEKSPQTLLFDRRAGSLDSLGLVNLIVAVELHAEEDLGVTISLADQKAMSQVGNVFQSVRSLVDYIISLLGAETNGTE